MQYCGWTNHPAHVFVDSCERYETLGPSWDFNGINQPSTSWCRIASTVFQGSDVITHRGNIIEKSAICCCGCGFLGRFPVSYLYRISFVGFPHENSHYHGYNHVFMVVKSLLVEYSTDIPIIMLFNNHSQWLNKIPSFGCEYPG